ncbi:hypothetical protein GGE24_005050 [Bradyrhizobium centrosematis]|nr:hypothetical protein [Bradyrhizobium centrosematis]MCS3775711.1 hypothetical protein [Bradyrhizobium centrosematis]
MLGQGRPTEKTEVPASLDPENSMVGGVARVAGVRP